MGNCQTTDEFDCGRDFELCYCKERQHDQNQYKIFMTPKNIQPMKPHASIISSQQGAFNIRQSPKTLDNIVKLQAVYRGHRTRKRLTQQQFQQHMSFGQQQISNDGSQVFVKPGRLTSSNPVVREIIQNLGPYYMQQPESPSKQSQNELEYRYALDIRPQVFYEGQWIVGENVRQGIGRQLWSDGTVYEGAFKQDKATGKGRLVHADGDVYEGDWVEDRAHGFGVYTRVSGARYEGFWCNDRQHGKGKEWWPDGSEFIGDYADGKKDGQGRQVWNDGNWYEGQFQANVIQGIGTYVWKNGRRYEGEWFEGRMHGKGLFTWPDGRKYEGDFMNDLREGFGIYEWPDGRVYRGHWKEGKMDGEGTYISESGKIKQGLWRNGKRQQKVATDEGQECQETQDHQRIMSEEDEFKRIISEQEEK